MSTLWQSLYSRSYIPYIKKNNIALALDTQGKYHSGVTIENSSYPLSISPIIISIAGCILNNGLPKIVYIPPKQSVTYSEKSIIKSFNTTIKEIELPNLSLNKPLLSSNICIWECMENLIHQAYTPISDFPVACLLETKKGYIDGVNIEIEDDINLGLCAERIAIGRAASMGLLDQIQHIHIYAPKSDFISPCGACRQVLMETIPECRISCWYSRDSRSSYPLYQLLPHSFFMNEYSLR